MARRKGWLAGVLAAAMLCGNLFMPGMAGMGAGILEAHAAQNVALNKPVTVSALESPGQWTGELAVDGISDTDASRWSGGKMKGGADVSPQWIVIDLKADRTAVESINIKFFKLVWSTNYKIQTSDTEDGNWEDLHTITNTAGTTQNLENTVTGAEVSELKRYVRFYFEELNSNAGGNCISVREIAIMGTQSGIVTDVTSAQEALDQISELEVSREDRQLEIPQPENYEITVHGSEVDRVIGDDGSIAPYRISPRSFQVILKAVSKTDASDTAKKSFTVTVPDNRELYPELYPQVSDPNPMPDVLPTLQEWYGYEGAFTLTEGTEIVVNDTAQAGLLEVAKEMQADLEEICGETFAVKTGVSCDADDIYLESLTEDVYGTGEEGYFLVNGEEGLRIYASSKTGALYGTVTVEQILYQDEAHVKVPKGVIRDYPLYGVRGIMFDVARIPTRMQFLKDYTKILKWYKLNEMQVHLNDNQWSEPAYSPNYADWEKVEASHRLQSELFPSLATQPSKFQRAGDNEGRYDYYYSTHTGKDGELYYTKDEYRELQQQAEDRGISLIAELDTPGHSAAYTKYVYANQEEVIKSLVDNGYLEWDDYLDADGELKEGASFYIHNTRNFELLAVDDESTDAITRQNAINAKIFMTALFDEYLGGSDPLFTSDTISAGVDEYWDKNSANNEAFRRYMNYMYELLGEGYGKEVRMWGALGAITGNTEVNNNIVLDIWATYEDDPIARMNDGFNVINIPQPYLYTTPGRYHKDMVREEYIYYNWDPVIFNGNVRAQKGEPQLLGAKAALWGDENREGITEADLNERYLRVAAMLSEKTWGGTKEDDTFLEYEQTFDRLREGPGTEIANHIESKTNVVLNYDFENVSKDKKTVYDASGNGYNGSIVNGSVAKIDGETMLKFDGSTVIDTPLQSLGYPYTMSFDVYLDGTESNNKESSLFSGYDGRLQLAGMNGELSLNRDYFAQSFGYKVAEGEKHRITVVGTYQVTKLYVDGVFTKILYAKASDPDNGGKIDESTWTDADNNFRTTFVFPLNVIGKNFSGYLGNIKAYNKALSVEELEAEAKGPQMSAEVDVARNRGAYADNNNTAFWGDQMRLYPAWKATDGDGHVTGVTGVSTAHESRWNSSNSDTDFLMIDLGKVRKISRVVIDWEASRYAAAYDIQVSEDQVNWTTVKNVTDNTQALTDDSFEAIPARYVKMQGVRRRTGSNEYCIYEMKAYEQVDKSWLSISCNDMERFLKNAGIGWESTGVEKNLYGAYAYAKAVLNDVMAGQDETDQAFAAMTSMKGIWEEKLTEMKQMLDKAEAVFGDEDKYTEESWAKFQAAYDAVKNADAGITKEELSDLMAALETAQNGLTKKGIQPPVVVKTLAAPQVISVKSTKTKVKVTWKAVSNAASYQLYRKVGAKAIAVGSPVKGTTGYDTNPVGGKNMYYYVVALAGGQKNYKNSQAGAGKTIKLPKMSSKVTAAQIKGKKSVTVKWKAVKGASSYIVYRSEKKNGPWKQLRIVKKNKGTTYKDSKGLKKGKTYYYKVVTVASKKYSPMKAAKKKVKIK